MRLRILGLVVLLGAALAVGNYLRPIPAVEAGLLSPAQRITEGAAPAMPWPSSGAAAIGVSGIGVLATSGNEQPIPAASVTKVMTALLVLEDKPLKKGEMGPTITITTADVQEYLADKADQQSVVAVQDGERLNEFQALQGLLVPSGNNIASLLARWDAGSVDAFVAKMNQRAHALGLAHTTFADTNGASTNTVSTPRDLTVLGMAAMQQEVLAQIVALPQAEMPVAGIVYNVDYVVGQNGIIGIKTGSGLQAGANFLFAATDTVDGHVITLYGCVMGQPTLDAAFNAAKALLGVMQATLHVRRWLARNETVAAYQTPWGSRTDLLSTVNVDLVDWPGMVLRQWLDTPSIVIDKPIAPGTREGILHMVLGDYSLDVQLVTAGALYPPGREWRLIRWS